MKNTNATWEEQSDTPDTPDTGLQKLYPKTDGKWYWLDDTGTEHQFGESGAPAPDTDAIHVNASSELTGLTGKTTPVDADVTVIEDSAASNAKKKLSWANIKATLVTYLGTLYAPIAKGVTNGDSHDHSGGDGGTIAYGSLSGTPSTFTPSTHAASHQSGGGDAIKIDDLAAGDDNTDLNVSTAKHGLAPKLPNDATKYLDGTGVYSTPAGGGGGGDADDITYDNSSSGLSASDVQGALDEIVTLVDGGGSSFEYYDAAKPPASPHAKDDEFEGSSLDGKWTVFQSGGMSVVVGDHLLQLTAASNAGDKVQGVFQTLPAGDWAIVTHGGLNRATFDAAGNTNWGLALFEDATGNPNTCDIYVNGYATAAAGGAPYEVVYRYSAYNAWNSQPAVLRPFETGAWVMISSVSGVLSYWVSKDGLGWWKWFSHTPAFTPAEFGLVVNNNAQGASIVGVFDFVRVFSAVPDYIGGTRESGGGGGGGGPSDAVDIDYDNSGSGLTSTNVQDAIDESLLIAGQVGTSLSVDGAGSPVTNGVKYFFAWPYDGVLTGWDLIADQSGDITFDIKDAAYASFPGSAATLFMTAPELTAAQKAQASGLTIPITKGHWAEVEISGAATIEFCTLALYITRN